MSAVTVQSDQLNPAAQADCNAASPDGEAATVLGLPALDGELSRQERDHSMMFLFKVRTVWGRYLCAHGCLGNGSGSWPSCPEFCRSVKGPQLLVNVAVAKDECSRWF
jgi:hypothetical protein